jgi:hypothetical protein
MCATKEEETFTPNLVDNKKKFPLTDPWGKLDYTNNRSVHK